MSFFRQSLWATSVRNAPVYLVMKWSDLIFGSFHASLELLIGSRSLSVFWDSFEVVSTHLMGFLRIFCRRVTKQFGPRLECPSLSLRSLRSPSSPMSMSSPLSRVWERQLDTLCLFSLHFSSTTSRPSFSLVVVSVRLSFGEINAICAPPHTCHRHGVPQNV